MGLKELLVGMGICCALGSCHLQNPAPVIEPLKKTLPATYTPKDDFLHVNITDQHYIVKKSQEEGEKNLQWNAKHARREEGLFYIEYSDGEKIWQESGIWEGPLGVEYVFDLALPYITPLLEKLYPYHHHPYDPIMDKDYDLSQTPSAADFEVCFDFMEYIDEFCPAYADTVKCGVVTTTGTYLITIDPITLDDQNAENDLFDSLVEMEEFMKKEVKQSELGKAKNFDYSPGNMKNFVKLNKKFCEKFSDDLIQIVFREFED